MYIRDVTGYPKPVTRNPKPGLFFDPKPETRPEKFSKTRPETRHFPWSFITKREDFWLFGLPKFSKFSPAALENEKI